MAEGCCSNANSSDEDEDEEACWRMNVAAAAQCHYTPDQVYALRLKNKRHGQDCFYVGKSKDKARRVNQHESGGVRCATWVKRQGGVAEEVQLLIPREANLDPDTWEQKETMARIIGHTNGFDCVRGWEWTNPEFGVEDYITFKKLALGAGNLCRTCGFPGHFATMCGGRPKAPWLVRCLEGCKPVSQAKRASSSRTTLDVSQIIASQVYHGQQQQQQQQPQQPPWIPSHPPLAHSQAHLSPHSWPPPQGQPQALPAIGGPGLLPSFPPPFSSPPQPQQQLAMVAMVAMVAYYYEARMRDHAAAYATAAAGAAWAATQMVPPPLASWNPPPTPPSNHGNNQTVGIYAPLDSHHHSEPMSPYAHSNHEHEHFEDNHDDSDPSDDDSCNGNDKQDVDNGLHQRKKDGPNKRQQCITTAAGNHDVGGDGPQGGVVNSRRHGGSHHPLTTTTNSNNNNSITHTNMNSVKNKRPHSGTDHLAHASSGTGTTRGKRVVYEYTNTPHPDNSSYYPEPKQPLHHHPQPQEHESIDPFMNHPNSNPSDGRSLWRSPQQQQQQQQHESKKSQASKWSNRQQQQQHQHHPRNNDAKEHKRGRTRRRTSSGTPHRYQPLLSGGGGGGSSSQHSAGSGGSARSAGIPLLGKRNEIDKVMGHKKNQSSPTSTSHPAQYHSHSSHINININSNSHTTGPRPFTPIGKTGVSALFELCDKQHWGAPKFVEIPPAASSSNLTASTTTTTTTTTITTKTSSSPMSGVTHHPQHDFILTVQVNDEELGRGRGGTKASARQDASRRALVALVPGV
eukprot:scaffold408133_cov61-Attheya_sp.AAC.1